MLWLVRRMNIGWSLSFVWFSFDTYICRLKGYLIMYLFKEKKRLVAFVVFRMGDIVYIYFFILFMYNYYILDIKVNCKKFLMLFKLEKCLVLIFLMIVWSILI